MKKYTFFVIYSLFFFIVNCTLKIEDCPSQWYQINLPVSGSVYKMQFINSNTGWATVKQSTYLYSLIRTTNSGVNWNVIYSDSEKVKNFQFINDTLGYAMGYSHLFHLLLKTTNSGYNWTIMQNSSSYVYSGFYFVNADTGWVSAFLIPTQRTLRTTNGFQTLEQISIGGGGTPATIYFFKEKYNGEYFGYILGAGILSKTTNSGYNWQQINFSESGNVNSFSFLNRDTGWVVFNPNVGIDKIELTLNGGQNWIPQYYDTYNDEITSINAVNYNKIWSGVGNNYILVSTNSGNIWGKQYSQILAHSGIYMCDTSVGFAWNVYSINNFAKTTNGGGPITSIEKISSIIPSIFELKQNYPNPFNSSTAIEFDVSKNAVISLILYDILGREIMKIIDAKEIIPGSYKTLIDLNNYNFSGGIYFYRLTAFEKVSGKIFQISKKMIYSK